MKIYLVVALCLILGAACVAGTVIVPDDYSSIQSALDAVAAFDTVVVKAGTYTGAGNNNLVFPVDNISLIAEDGPVVTELNGQFDGITPVRACELSSSYGDNILISGFTFTNFGGAMRGGAVFNATFSSLIENCRFIQNSASNWGGAIYGSEGSHLFLIDCEFSANQTTEHASYGGAIGGWGASFTAENCLFKQNVAPGYGGAMFFSHGNTPTFTDCQFIGNDAIHGGAIGHYAVDGSYTGCTIVGNSASQLGGAVFLQDRCSPVFANGTVYDNSGGTGSAFYIQERNSANASEPVFENMLVAFNSDDRAFYVIGSSAAPVFSCTDIFGNPGNWVGYLAPFFGVNGNISNDPLFCDTASGNLHLTESSPCAPANNSCGVLMGSMLPGCDDSGPVMTPDPMYALYQFAIEPLTGECIIPMTEAPQPVDNIVPASIRLNGSIEPSRIEILPPDPPLGSGLRIEFPVTEFIQTYPLMWDTSRQDYTITGEFSDATPFEIAGQMTFIGHASGDANADGVVNVGDIVYLVNYVFRGGDAPPDMRLAEVNCDGALNIGDAVYLIQFIFLGGSAPGYCPF